MHCAAMCGGFASWYSSLVRETTRAHVAYHGGRLFCYALLGAAAGAAGAGIDRLGSMAGVHRSAAVLAAVLLIVTGVRMIFPGLHLRRADHAAARAAAPQSLIITAIRSTFASALRRIVELRGSLPPSAVPLALGLLTALLPCGWLWLYVATAASSGSALSGSITMAAFWAGTVPALLFIGHGARCGTSRLSRTLPRLAGCLLFGAGLWSLAAHVSTGPTDGASGCGHAASAEVHGATPNGGSDVSS